jgi:hypothetical protein
MPRGLMDFLTFSSKMAKSYIKKSISSSILPSSSELTSIPDLLLTKRVSPTSAKKEK